MTKLDAIQLIMMKVGLLPVTTLETGSASTAANIERILDMRTKMVCEEGWHFNQRRCVKVTPTSLAPTGTLPITIHLCEGLHQQTHPLVTAGTVQIMPAINMGFQQSDTRDPLFYYYAGQNDAQLITNVANAILTAKAAGKRVFIQVVASGLKWCRFTDQADSGAAGSFGELNHTKFVTAVNAGKFDNTSEKARSSGIISGILSALGSVRPDGIYHDVEYAPTVYQIITTGTVEGATTLAMS